MIPKSSRMEKVGQAKVWMFIPELGPVVPNTIGAAGKGSWKAIDLPKKSGRSTIRVAPCVDHSSPRPSILTDVWVTDSATKARVRLGQVRACPFCWSVFSELEGDELYIRWENYNLGEDEMKVFAQAKISKRKARYQKIRA